MGGIFISYRRDDTPWCAGRLHDVLARVFDPRLLFMDVESIEAGDPFKARIAKGIADSEIVIVLIGRRWLGVDAATGKRRIDDPKDFVQKEVAEALDQEKAVVPVLVDDATLPERGELPESISRVVDRQAEHLRYADFEQDSRALIAVIERSVKRPRMAWRMPALTRARVAATAGLCLLTMAAGYWAGSLGQTSPEELGTAAREGGYQQARQDLLNEIEGFVTDAAGVPLVEASIAVRVGSAVKQTTTVEGGMYAVNIADLKPQLNDPIEVSARADSFKERKVRFLYRDGFRRHTMVLTK